VEEIIGARVSRVQTRRGMVTIDRTPAAARRLVRLDLRRDRCASLVAIDDAPACEIVG